jgi:hypothetical protein
MSDQTICHRSCRRKVTPISNGKITFALGRKRITLRVHLGVPIVTKSVWKRAWVRLDKTFTLVKLLYLEAASRNRRRFSFAVSPPPVPRMSRQGLLILGRSH